MLLLIVDRLVLHANGVGTEVVIGAAGRVGGRDVCTGVPPAEAKLKYERSFIFLLLLLVDDGSGT